MQTQRLSLPASDPSRFPTDADLRGYDRAQSFAKMVARTIADRVKPGMSERDATAITYRIFQELGVRDHWHMPLVGVGEGSTKFASAGRFLKSLVGAHSRVLEEGDVLFLDIAPFFEGYPSDFTLTELYGDNARLERMIRTALELTRDVSTSLREDMVAGET
jgi:Xaa-Pro aminopeptidase